MVARALPVTTKFSHAGFGRESGLVMISTVWPLYRRVRNGASWRSTRAATQLLPTSECTA